MRWKSHVRFGERVGETDQPRGWHRAPARLHSGRSSGDSDPNQILKERLTRGEIDIEDYKRRRDLISSSRKGSGPSSFRFSSFGLGNHDDGGTRR